MSFLRRAAVAGMLAGTALASTTGSAFASEAGQAESGHDGDQHGVVNVGDVQTITPLTACNNDVPVNAAGVQVPVEDVSGALGLGLLGDEDSDGAAAQPESQSCGTGTDAAA